MKPLPQCAGSAAEAKDIVRALSEGRVRITQRAVAEPVGTRSTASSSCGPVRKVGDGVEPVPTRATRDLTKHDRLKLDMDAALARRYALGVAFDAQDVIEAMEGWVCRITLMRRMDREVLAGRAEELAASDPRRTCVSNGNRARATQWLPVQTP